MSENILQNIIQKKIEKVDKLKKSLDLKTLDELINKNNSYINFKEKIENNIKNNKTSIIAEIKKASPSAGIIIDDYNPVDIAQIYLNNKATCLSVLTEEDYFLGNLIHISKIKDKINLPILCKDFFIDKFQIPLANALIGINNRNLKTLKTDINTTYDIYDVVKSHKGPLISESGIKNKDELLELNNKTSINTFLIGESLLKNLDKNSIFSVL